MFRVALKSVLGNKLRFGLTALAVVLGVAFVSGVFVLTDSINRSFDGLFSEINEGTAVYVNPVSEIDAEIGGGTGAIGGPTLPEELVPTIEAVPGVEAVEGGVGGIAVILDDEGEKVGAQGGPPALGFSWANATGPLRIAEGDGRPPTGPDEVVIDRGSANLLIEDDESFGLGSTVIIVVQNQGPQPFTVVGFSTFGESDNLLGATTASFELSRAQELFEKPGQFDSIAVTSDGSVSDDVLAMAIASEVGDAYEVITGAQQTENDQQDIQQGLSFLTIGLLAFAGIALFVGAFIIINTFSIIIAQRTREFSLLRAIGASASQIRGAVMLEALVVGLVASVTGFFAGIALAAMLQAVMDAAGLSIPQSGIVVAPRTVIASFVVGVGVTFVSAVFPARRAAKISPIEGLHDAAARAQEPISRRRTIGGLAAAGLGVVSLLLGLLVVNGNEAALVGGGVAATFIGVALLAPHAAGPVARVLGSLPARLGVPGTLAQRNAGRNALRTASTASALMIGVALVAFVSIFTASAVKSVDVLFEEQFGADFAIQADAGFGPPQGIPTVLADQLRGLPEVGNVAGFRASNMRLDEPDRGNTFIASTDVQQIEGIANLGVVEGSDLADLLAPGTIMVDDEVAEKEGFSIGDRITASFAAEEMVELEIVGIFTNDEFVSANWLVTNEALTDLAGNVQDLFLGADAAEGVDLEAAQAAIAEVTDQYVNLQVLSQSELREETEAQVNGLLNGFIGLLFLAIIIAVIGIVNTLALSVFERTREIGLLRAVGMVRRQARSMIRWESVIVAIFGAILGLIVGTFFGWAMVQALKDFGITQLDLPWTRLFVYVVLAGFAGVIAAILPARRAARLDVLRAVTTE